MKILHYTLGFPPYRSGGLTKYSIDLARKQAEIHDVFVLWPGKYKGKKTRFIKTKNGNLLSIEMVNPILVPLVYGVSEPYDFMKHADVDVFIDLLKEHKVEIVHIHTLMGLYPEFIDACNFLKIKVFYTTHDYFGLCPNVKAFHNGKILDFDDFNTCALSNSHAISSKNIRRMQSGFYRFFKKTIFFKLLRRMTNIKDKIHSQSIIKNPKEYQDLQAYYIEMFNKMTLILANSPLTKEIFSNTNIKTPVRHQEITHMDIKDYRRTRSVNRNVTMIYIGPESDEKGFFYLISVLDELFKSYDFVLKVYSTENNLKRPYLSFQGTYGFSELENVFNQADMVIVPSLWNETFGFSVLEALSHAMPVIASSHVGSNYLLDESMIFEPNQLKDTLERILKNPKKIEEMNSYMLKKNIIKYTNMTGDIYE